jgi:uncharacterized repeat protein (TIGR03803 family)
MSKLTLLRATWLVCGFLAMGKITSSGQTFKTLATFSGTDGAGPRTALVQGHDGNFYGVTGAGGNYSTCPDAGCGTVFKISPAGNLTKLYDFCSLVNCVDGAGPVGLVLATDGNFYGTTTGGVEEINLGTVFKITPYGNLTTLSLGCDLGFCGDPDGPSILIQAADGNFYGTTTESGANCGSFGCGTVFEVTAQGALIRIYSFCSRFECADGSAPEAGLVQGPDGNFYGTTASGGASNTNCRSGCGTVFKMTPTGKLTTVYRFCVQTNCSDGAFPATELVKDAGGNFYGATEQGGTTNSLCRSLGCGTLFKIDPSGKLTTIYKFCVQANCADGAQPQALMQATNGNFYGISLGGTYNSACDFRGCGTVFEITPRGKLTTLHRFCTQTSCGDGDLPSGLAQLTNGVLYGSTLQGGDIACNPPSGCGTIYALSIGLGPFVETNPTSGKVGQAVVILGHELTGTTSVTFNGTASTFTVVSSTEIKTTVPSGATNGFVKVMSPMTTLKSNMIFRVAE